MKELLEAGVLSKIKHGVKVLGKGANKITALDRPITLEVSDASTNAITAIKETGGQISVKYRTQLMMRNHLKPHKFNPNK